MPRYRLTYFPLKGRAETARQIFAIAGVDYEDKRIAQDQWATLKSKTQFGQLPTLEFDGIQLAQSEAINRFLARQYGLAGKGAIEEAQVDALVELTRDYREEIKEYFMVIAGWAKGDKEALYKEKVVPAREKFFNHLKKLLAKSGSGFLVPSGLTYVDLTIAEHLSQFKEKNPTFLNGYPEIQAYVDRVRQNPKLKRWLEVRPKTDF